MTDPSESVHNELKDEETFKFPSLSVKSSYIIGSTEISTLSSNPKTDEIDKELNLNPNKENDFSQQHEPIEKDVSSYSNEESNKKPNNLESENDVPLCSENEVKVKGKENTLDVMNQVPQSKSVGDLNQQDNEEEKEATNYEGKQKNVPQKISSQKIEIQPETDFSQSSPSELNEAFIQIENEDENATHNSNNILTLSLLNDEKEEKNEHEKLNEIGKMFNGTNLSSISSISFNNGDSNFLEEFPPEFISFNNGGSNFLEESLQELIPFNNEDSNFLEESLLDLSSSTNCEEEEKED